MVSRIVAGLGGLLKSQTQKDSYLVKAIHIAQTKVEVWGNTR